MSNAILQSLISRGIEPNQAQNFATQFDQSSPNFDPSMQAQPMAPQDNRSPMAGLHPEQQFMQSAQPAAQAPAQQPGVQGQPQEALNPQDAEAQMILNTLADRLTHHSKMKDKAVGAIINQINANNQAQQPQGV